MKGKGMKCLSVKQPWANCIIHWDKEIENRTWKTNYRGRLYIHASSVIKKKSEMLVDMAFIGSNSKRGRPYTNVEIYREWLKQLPLGCIIGHVDLVDIVIESDNEWFQGPYGWVLENPVKLKEPIPCKGRLGLWEYKNDKHRIVGSQNK